jgi:hypothetical protein
MTIDQNTATWDRALRLLIGVLLLAMVFIGPRTPLGWLGLIFIATAAIGFCPLYRVVGISTCRAKSPSGR